MRKKTHTNPESSEKEQENEEEKQNMQNQNDLLQNLYISYVVASDVYFTIIIQMHVYFFHSFTKKVITNEEKKTLILAKLMFDKRLMSQMLLLIY